MSILFLAFSLTIVLTALLVLVVTVVSNLVIAMRQRTFRPGVWLLKLPRDDWGIGR